MKRLICVNAKDTDLTLREVYTPITEIDTAIKVMNDKGKCRFYSRARFVEKGE